MTRKTDTNCTELHQWYKQNSTLFHLNLSAKLVQQTTSWWAQNSNNLLDTNSIEKYLFVSYSLQLAINLGLSQGGMFQACSSKATKKNACSVIINCSVYFLHIIFPVQSLGLCFLYLGGLLDWWQLLERGIKQNKTWCLADFCQKWLTYLSSDCLKVKDNEQEALTFINYIHLIEICIPLCFHWRGSGILIVLLLLLDATWSSLRNFKNWLLVCTKTTM